MSADAQDGLPLLCELGWHRPEKLARWNDGYYFSKCMRCKRDLVRTAYGHWQVPKGFKVVWQPKPPETRVDIALVPQEAAATAGAPVDRVDIPAGDMRPAEPAAAERIEPAPTPKPEPEVARAAERQPEPPEPEPAPSQPEISPVTAEMARQEPMPASVTEPVPVPVLPPPAPEPRHVPQQRLSRAQQLFQDAPSPPADAAVAETQAEVAQNVIDPVNEEDEPRLPIEDPRADTAPVDEAVYERPEGRNELPIEEVLRHLHSTPLPATPPENGTEETAAVEEAAPAAEAGEAAPPEEAPEEVAAVPDHLPIAEAEATAAEPEAVAEPVEEASVSGLIAVEAAEPVAEPAPPPRPRAPIRPAYSDWDFMEEDEEDSISSFWENPEPSVSPAPTAAEASTAEPEAAQPEAAESGEETPAPASETAYQEPSEPTAPPPAEEEPEIVPVAAAVAADPPAPAPAEEPPVAAAPAPVEETSFFTAAAAAEARAERLEDTVPSFRVPEPVEPGSEADEVPPWVDAADASQEEEEHSAKRSSQFALAAVASIVIVAAVVALSNRPDGQAALEQTPAPAVQEKAAPAPAAQPSAQPASAARQNTPSPTPSPAPLIVRRDAPAASPKAAAPAVQPPFVGRPAYLAPMPALPAREVAFVSASVLQCRSAPVDRAPPVRKLVRGAQVQVLAREGAFVSVAHKGRQCWAAARFLSAAQPW